MIDSCVLLLLQRHFGVFQHLSTCHPQDIRLFDNKDPSPDHSCLCLCRHIHRSNGHSLRSHEETWDFPHDCIRDRRCGLGDAPGKSIPSYLLRRNVLRRHWHISDRYSHLVLGEQQFHWLHKEVCFPSKNTARIKLHPDNT